MKRIKINTTTWFLSLLTGVSMFFSCVDDINFGDRFLEKDPGVDVNIDTIFSKGEYTKQFLWNLYNHINCPFNNTARLNQVPIESLSDIFHSYCSWGGPNTTYYPGLITENSQNPYGNQDKFPFTTAAGSGNQRIGIWDAIRKGWILIENMERVPDLSSTEKSQLKGETYLIMATRYFDAFRNFGGLPLIDHAFEPGEEVEGGRATAEETVKFIDDLIQSAIDEPGFPWRIEDLETWAGRLTKSGAVALRAKLYLFAASPLFNDTKAYLEYTNTDKGENPLHIWYGGEKREYWTKCLEACEKFFELNRQNGNFYALIQPKTNDEEGYCEAFREAYWFRGNSEKIIEVHSKYKTGQWGWDEGPDISNAVHFGMANPTLEYMEMFPMADGKNYPYKNIYGTDNPSNIDIFANRDPRLYETILVTREKLREDYMGMPSVAIWQGGDIVNNTSLNKEPIRFETGMALYKWILDFGKAYSYPMSYSYIRMADMHLTYAEALAETGNLPKACEEINKVRARVGLGKIETMNPELDLTNNTTNLINEILRERAVEFGLEDERLYDIIRRKAIDKFTSPLHELVTWRKTSEGKKWEKKEGDQTFNTLLQDGEAFPNFIYEKRQVTVGARIWWSENGWSNKFLLSPLPRNEINKEYGLTQNPGW